MEKQSQNTTTPEQPILVGTLPDWMILVEGGTFEMGSHDQEALIREQPVHQVMLDGFYIGKYPAIRSDLWRVKLKPSKLLVSDGTNARIHVTKPGLSVISPYYF